MKPGATASWTNQDGRDCLLLDGTDYWVDSGTFADALNMSGNSSRTVMAWVNVVGLNDGAVFEVGSMLKDEFFALSTVAPGPDTWVVDFGAAYTGQAVPFRYSSTEPWIHFAVVMDNDRNLRVVARHLGKSEYKLDMALIEMLHRDGSQNKNSKALAVGMKKTALEGSRPGSSIFLSTSPVVTTHGKHSLPVVKRLPSSRVRSSDSGSIWASTPYPLKVAASRPP